MVSDTMDTDDWQLLNDYAARNSEAAFRTLVDRYAGLVYQAAFGRVRNPHQAEEVTQAVFIALARKAAKIPRHVPLSGWLFQATRFAAINLVRSETRRQHYEQEAAMTQTIPGSDEDERAWENISPHLYRALDKLPKKDRDAVLIRFFEKKSHKEVGEMLGLSEAAAKVRISRAVDRLRSIFAKEGFATPSAALLAALSSPNAQAAPSGLVASVAAAALAKGTGVASSTVVAADAILKFMALSKLNAVVTTVVILFLMAATTGLILTKVAGPHASSPQAAGTTAADRTSPKGTMLVMTEAMETGDASAYIESFIFKTDAELKMKSALEGLAVSTGKFVQGLQTQFGTQAAHAAFPNLPFVIPTNVIPSAIETIQGDSATITFPGGKFGRPIQFTRANNEWKMTADGFLHLNPAVLKDLYRRVIRALDQTSPEIPQKKYKTAMEAVEGVKERAR